MIIEDTRRRSSGCLETLIVTENWSDGSKPSIVEMVCFIESLAKSETPLEITVVSRGSIRLSMLAITENSLSKPVFCVETKSSETPPPSTPETRQLTTVEVEEGRVFFTAVWGSNCRPRSWREIDEGGRWRGLRDRSVTRERKKALALAAIKESEPSKLCGSVTLSLSLSESMC